jgi:hypothetical protein
VKVSRCSDQPVTGHLSSVLLQYWKGRRRRFCDRSEGGWRKFRRRCQGSIWSKVIREKGSKPERTERMLRSTRNRTLNENSSSASFIRTIDRSIAVQPSPIKLTQSISENGFRAPSTGRFNLNLIELNCDTIPERKFQMKV